MKDKNSKSFGQLKSKPISSSFPKEAVDFTPWLAGEDTLNQYLGPILNLSFSNVRVEVAVDESRIDILAEDEDGSKIIIENQYGKTDHDHLGKLITYASGVEARYIIWITEKSKQNHQKAIDWLNDNVCEDIHFFLLEAEILQIDDSKPVPKFNVVVTPNDWSKTSKYIARDNPQAESFHAFWYRLCQVATDRPDLKVSWSRWSPTRQSWMNASAGLAEGHLVARQALRGRRISMEFYIGDDKDTFDRLYDKREEIEAALGYQLDWRRLNNRKCSKAILFGDYLENEDNRMDWFIKRAEEFAIAFRGQST